MRDTTIESGKEKGEISLAPSGVDLQESPFPRYISRNVFNKFANFTPEAKTFFADKLRAFAEQLIQNSGANAEEQGLDIVSAKNVELALHLQQPPPRSRFRKFAGVFGGILLGAGVSVLLSMLLTEKATMIGSVLAFGLSVVGAFLIALDK